MDICDVYVGQTVAFPACERGSHTAGKGEVVEVFPASIMVRTDACPQKVEFRAQPLRVDDGEGNLVPVFFVLEVNVEPYVYRGCGVCGPQMGYVDDDGICQNCGCRG